MSFLLANYRITKPRLKHNLFVVDHKTNMILNQTLVFFVALFASSILVLSVTVSPVVGLNAINILPPGGKPYGLTYEDHIKNFWKWIISFPIPKSPWKDQTGANCDNGQSATNSPIFYLSGNGGGKSVRTCKVPAGKALFIPVSPMEESDKESPGASIQQLSKDSKKDQDSVTSLYLKIDDKVYNFQELSKYRTHTSAFDVIFPDNAIFGATKGNSKSVADGYYVITEPLPKGTHTIQYKSSLICAGTDCVEPNFAQDVAYKIIVE
jgi:hypothetical protein